MKVAIQQTSDLKNYIVTTDDGREFIVKNIDEAIELKVELHYIVLKEQIRLKAIEAFKGREDIIYERMNQLNEDLKNGKYPFLDIDKILK